MQTTYTIRLTLNGETREVEAVCFDFHPDDLYVYRLEVKTSHGNKLHKGTVTLSRKPEGHEYTARDISSISYHGMRGNGHARRSSFRYVGFPKQ